MSGQINQSELPLIAVYFMCNLEFWMRFVTMLDYNNLWDMQRKANSILLHNANQIISE